MKIKKEFDPTKFDPQIAKSVLCHSARIVSKSERKDSYLDPIALEKIYENLVINSE